MAQILPVVPRLFAFIHATFRYIYKNTIKVETLGGTGTIISVL